MRFLLAGFLAVLAGGAAARDEAATAGPWTLALVGSPRACGLTLSADPAAGSGRAVRFPAGCRRALPILGDVASWSIEGDAVRLGAGDGRAVLVFAARPDGDLIARAESGQEFRLTAPARDEAPTPAVTPAAFAPPDTVPAMVPEGGVAGLYALDRFVERDTCRVVLAPGTDGGAARLAEGCRDGGLAMFDPVSWRYETGRLTLVARRGHEVGLVALPGRRWRRDPETGTTFVLRRVEP